MQFDGHTSLLLEGEKVRQPTKTLGYLRHELLKEDVLWDFLELVDAGHHGPVPEGIGGGG
jgi:hypothetical protein